MATREVTMNEAYDIGEGLGKVTRNGDRYTIRAVGNQLADVTTDSFYFLAHPHDGDGMLTIHALNMVNTHPYAKVAVQIRQDLSNGSPNAMMEWQPNKYIY